MWGSKGQWLGSTLQRLQGILHMRGLPGLLLQCTCSVSGLNIACEYAHACRQACTPILVAHVVFLFSQHDRHVLCWVAMFMLSPTV